MQAHTQPRTHTHTHKRFARSFRSVREGAGWLIAGGNCGDVCSARTACMLGSDGPSGTRVSLTTMYVLNFLTTILTVLPDGNAWLGLRPYANVCEGFGVSEPGVPASERGEGE